MKLIDIIIRDYKSIIEHKKILEIACDQADLAMACLPIADQVMVTDDVMRFKGVRREELYFQAWKPLRLSQLDYQAEIILCFNGLKHVVAEIPQLLDEILSFKELNTVLFIQTRSLERQLSYRDLLPALHDKRIRYSLNENSYYQCLEIRKKENKTHCKR